MSNLPSQPIAKHTARKLNRAQLKLQSAKNSEEDSQKRCQELEDKLKSMEKAKETMKADNKKEWSDYLKLAAHEKRHQENEIARKEAVIAEHEKVVARQATMIFAHKATIAQQKTTITDEMVEIDSLKAKLAGYKAVVLEVKGLVDKILSPQRPKVKTEAPEEAQDEDGPSKKRKFDETELSDSEYSD